MQREHWMSENEIRARRQALQRYGVLDNGPEEEFEQIIVLARMLFSTPMAAITLIDGQRQWIKGQRGLMMRHGAIDLVFAAHTLMAEGALCVEDALHDPRFRDDASVQGPPGLRAYAGAPLVTPDGTAIGTICVLDTVARDFSATDGAVMEQLARITMGSLELRLIASKDGATGVDSRRAFMDALGKELERHRRTATRAALVLCRVGGLGPAILTGGPEAADTALADVATRIGRVLRKSDVIGRVANNAFAVLIADAGEAEAAIATGRFRTAVADARTGGLAIEFAHVAVTAGFETAGDWLRAAEDALRSATGAPSAGPRRGDGARWMN